MLINLLQDEDAQQDVPTPGDDAGDEGVAPAGDEDNAGEGDGGEAGGDAGEDAGAGEEAGEEAGDAGAEAGDDAGDDEVAGA